jgi:DNA-binding SARP family transcriptional activator
MRARDTARPARLAKGLAALVVLAALVAGIPWALWHSIGWPLPHHVPSTGQIGHVLTQHGIAGRTLVDVLAVVVWVTWAVLVASVAAEIPAALAGRRVRRLPVAGVFQPLAGRLVAAVVVAALALAPRAAHSQPAGSPRTGLVALRRPVAALVLTGNSRPASPHAPPRPPPGADTSPIGAPVVPPLAAGLSGPAPHASPGTQVADQMRTYVVQRGDTLWGIAERELGDPLRWSEIYALNEGRPQPGGVTLTDPHWIDPGWTLLLPTSVATVIPPTAAPSPPPSSPPRSPSSPPEPSPGRASAPATNRPTTLGPPSRVVSPATPPPMEPPVRTVPDWTGHPLVPAQVNGTAPHQADRSSGPVRLPSGSVVGGSFVAGLLSAVALGRLRRRHAYRYRPPEPGRHLGPDPLRPTLRRLASARCRDVDPGDVSAGDADESAVPVMAPPPGVSLLADDDPEHRERPDLVEVGTRDGHPVVMALSELGGVTLAGSHASQVAAAWVAALMVRAGPRAAEVVMTRPALDELFGPGALPGPVPGLRVVDRPEAVLSSLERMVLSRTRQLIEDDVPDVVAYRRANPWEPVPMVLAVIDEVPGADAGRWAATVAAGPRLGFAVFTCDPHAAMPARLVMGTDRVVSTGMPDELAARLIGAELFALRSHEAADVVATLAETEERPDGTAAGITALDETAWPRPVSSAEITPADPSTTLRAVSANDALPIEPPEPPTAPETAPVRVTVFGPCEIAVDGEVVSKGLRTMAKELLAWLCLRPEGASVEAAVEALWPDTERSRVHKQFWQAATNLRTRLGTADDPDTKVLVQSGDVYRLDPAALGCDLWVFQDALGAAARADDDRVARAALRQAVDAYRGELLAGIDYPWVEPVRQDLHRRALDAHLRLADLEDRLGNPDAADATLHRAIDINRYAEEPYRRLMALQADRGRLDAVADTWRLLQERLDEIDVDPEPATVRLHRSLAAPEDSPAERARRARLPL